MYTSMYTSIEGGSAGHKAGTELYAAIKAALEGDVAALRAAAGESLLLGAIGKRVHQSFALDPELPLPPLAARDAPFAGSDAGRLWEDLHADLDDVEERITDVERRDANVGAAAPARERAVLQHEHSRLLQLHRDIIAQLGCYLPC